MAAGLPTLFRSFTIVTPDKAGGVHTLENGHVVVKGDRIAYVGTDHTLAEQTAGPGSFVTMPGNGNLMLPAFANAHGHTAMVLMRNRADDLNLHAWLHERIFPMEARMRRQDVLAGSQLGIAQMIRTGTGACADMYFYPEATLEAAVAAGIRMNLCCEGQRTDPQTGHVVFLQDEVRSFARTCREVGQGRILPSLMVHSIYLYEAAAYPRLAAIAQAENIPIHTHLAETQKEVADCLEQYGCTPAVQMERFGLFDASCLAAHGVYLTDEDMALLASRQVTVAHNPASNLKLGSGVARIGQLMARGIPVALGTDGAASNNTLDMYREMRLASLLAKGQALDAAVVPAAVALRMATCTGMTALGFHDSGYIEPGMKADLQILDAGDLSLYPLGDPLSALVYSASASAVDSLMVDGHMLMRKKELLTLDEERILYDAASASKHLLAGEVRP